MPKKTKATTKRRHQQVFESSSSEEEEPDVPPPRPGSSATTSSRARTKRTHTIKPVPAKHAVRKVLNTGAAVNPEQDDDEIDKALADRKAQAAALPVGVTASTDLKWFVDENDRYFPCRICDKSEAMFVNLTPLWDEEEVTLIQALEYPPTMPFHGQRDRILADRTSLKSFGSSKKWNQEYWKKHVKQRQQEGRGSSKVLCKSDVLAGYGYLNRILEAALKKDEAEAKKQESTTMVLYDEADNSDLETPYELNPATVVAPSTIMPPPRFHEKKKEPLRPGDVVTYCSPIFCAGDKRGERTATVISTNPLADYMIRLDNKELLPNETFVKRIQVIDSHTKVLYKHRGFLRPIKQFVLKKRKLNCVDTKTIIMAQAERIGTIVDENVRKMGGDDDFGFLSSRRKQAAQLKKKESSLHHDSDNDPLKLPCAMLKDGDKPTQQTTSNKTTDSQSDSSDDDTEEEPAGVQYSMDAFVPKKKPTKQTALRNFASSDSEIDISPTRISKTREHAHTQVGSSDSDSETSVAPKAKVKRRSEDSHSDLSALLTKRVTHRPPIEATGAGRSRSNATLSPQKSMSRANTLNSDLSAKLSNGKGAGRRRAGETKQRVAATKSKVVSTLASNYLTTKRMDCLDSDSDSSLFQNQGLANSPKSMTKAKTQSVSPKQPAFSAFKEPNGDDSDSSIENAGLSLPISKVVGERRRPTDQVKTVSIDLKSERILSKNRRHIPDQVENSRGRNEMLPAQKAPIKSSAPDLSGSFDPSSQESMCVDLTALTEHDEPRQRQLVKRRQSSETRLLGARMKHKGRFVVEEEDDDIEDSSSEEQSRALTPNRIGSYRPVVSFSNKKQKQKMQDPESSEEQEFQEPVARFSDKTKKNEPKSSLGSSMSSESSPTRKRQSTLSTVDQESRPALFKAVPRKSDSGDLKLSKVPRDQRTNRIESKKTRSAKCGITVKSGGTQTPNGARRTPITADNKTQSTAHAPIANGSAARGLGHAKTPPYQEQRSHLHTSSSARTVAKVTNSSSKKTPKRRELLSSDDHDDDDDNDEDTDRENRVKMNFSSARKRSDPTAGWGTTPGTGPSKKKGYGRKLNGSSSKKRDRPPTCIHIG